MPRSDRVTPGENPFRSACVDALTYQPEAVGWDELERRFRRNGFRGALVGPHGHGKSTLMREIAERLGPTAAASAGGSAAAPECVRVRADDPDQHKSIRGMVRGVRQLLMIDGYDLLGRMDRLRILRRRRPTLVTSHRRTAMPTLLHCRTSPTLLGKLVGQLAPGVEAALGEAEIAALHDRHGGNVRDALHELYDRVAAGQVVDSSRRRATFSGP